MARKSRKNIIAKIEQKSKMYSAAAYMRLSVVKENIPSDSIENQLRIIEDFVLLQDDIQLEDYYIDINASGTTFNRHEFQRMLQDIADEKINCVIVKDLSRFGREHIDVGLYLEKYFPVKGVRFISINENWDSVDGVTNKDNLKMKGAPIPLTNLMNEAFVKDIRQKTQNSIELCIKQGGFVAPRAPFGYQKAPDNCHQLIVDSIAAGVVRRIFNMAVRQMGLTEIVHTLNQEKILTPISYAITNGLKGNYDKGNGLWNTRSVKKILTNITYTGVLVQGKENILIENTHEAIVSKIVFDRIQYLLSGKPHRMETTVKSSIEDNPLKGKVICGNCGGKLQRKRGAGNADWYFFTCITKNRIGAEHCSGMYVRETAVIDAVCAELSNRVRSWEDEADKRSKEQLDLKLQIDCLERDLESQNKEHQKIYEDMVLGKISTTEYSDLKSVQPDLKSELLEKRQQLEQMENEMKIQQQFCDVEAGECDLKDVIGRYLSTVKVYDDKQIVVEFSI